MATLRADQTPETTSPSLEVTFQLRTLRPCPGCTNAEAVVLGAEVFDAAFSSLREQANSGRLSRVFCMYAELAGTIENCKATLGDVGGTTLDAEWVDVPGSPTTLPPTRMQWPPTPSPTVEPPSAPPTAAETLETSISYDLSDDCEEFTAENILSGADGNPLKEGLIVVTTHVVRNTRVYSSTMKTEEPIAYCKELGLALADSVEQLVRIDFGDNIFPCLGPRIAKTYAYVRDNTVYDGWMPDDAGCYAFACMAREEDDAPRRRKARKRHQGLARYGRRYPVTIDDAVDETVDCPPGQHCVEVFPTVTVVLEPGDDPAAAAAAVVLRMERSVKDGTFAAEIPGDTVPICPDRGSQLEYRRRR